MDTRKIQPKSTAADWVNMIIAGWMVVSPAVLGFSRHAAMWNNVAVGIALLLLNLAMLRRLETGIIPALIIFIAAWIFLSPFVLGFSKTAFLWNNVIMAFVVITGTAIGQQAHEIRFGTKSTP